MLYMNQMPNAWEEEMRTRIGRNIRRKRVEAGWSINRMYAETGIQRYTIQRWESGERKPDIVTLLWLIKVTGWKMSELVGASGGKSNGCD